MPYPGTVCPSTPLVINTPPMIRKNAEGEWVWAQNGHLCKNGRWHWKENI